MQLLSTNLLKLMTALLLLIASWGLSQVQLMQRLDNVLIDSFISLRSPVTAEGVAIIAVDSNSMAEYGYWPWPRSMHAKLLDILADNQTAPVVFDILFSEKKESDLLGDKAFAHAIETHGKVVLAASAELDSHTGKLNEFLPTAEFLSVAAGIGHTNVPTDRDGVSRGIYLNSGMGASHWPALALSALYVKEQVMLENRPNVENSTLYDAEWLRSKKVFFPLERVVIPVYSYKDVLSGTVTTELTGKTVFVGMTSVGLGQVFSTPAGVMPGVEFQANIFYSLGHDQQIFDELTWQYWLGFILLILGGLWCLHSNHYHSWGLILATLYIVIMSNILLTVKVAMPAVSIWAVIVVFYFLRHGQRLEYLSHIASKDELTGLCNRRQFDADFEKLWKRNQRESDSISLFILDIDFFKQINDEFGHATGDTVLFEFANVLQKQFRREIENIYRVGGEEFTILWQENDEELIKAYAQNLVNTVRNEMSTKMYNGQSIPVTVSVGCICVDSQLHFDKQHFYERADQALYEAKKSGRNQAVFAGQNAFLKL